MLKYIYLGFGFTFVLFLSSCASIKPPQILNTITNSQQVLLVEPLHPKSSYGILSAWENKGRWQKVYQSRVSLGRTGIALKNTKREGDGHTPSGIYPIKRAFGYAEHMKTRLDYHQSTTDDFWVDDASSPQYNQWVHGKPQAKSFEEMRRKDHLYSMGAVIEYNTNPIVPGNGSAIFLHVWRSYYKPTSGCVALSSRYIRKILAWLDKDQNPVIVLSP